jgi:uncharacterized membrane protein
VPPSPPPSDAERIRLLEEQVRELSTRLSELEPPRRRRPASERVVAALDRRRAERWSLQGEQWTGRVGLLLLFLGLVFLFRYSVEQGWITPSVRVVFGGVLGTSFLIAGIRAARARPSYAAILLAGATASYYATGWAASYLYELLPRPVAFAWMAAVTVLAFTLARRYRQPALASLGALGGFATPFLLRPDSATVVELVIYTMLVVLWISALYLREGWRSVSWTSLVGGLTVISIAAARAEGAELWLVQFALILTWAAGAAVPFVYGWRNSTERDPFPGSVVPHAIELRLLGAAGSAAAVAITARTWELSDPATGSLFVVVAAVYGAFAWLGTRRPSFVARSAAPVAAALAATGSFLVLGDGPARWYVVAGLGAACLAGGRTTRFRGLEWVGHGLFALLAIGILRELVNGGASFSAVAWAHLIGLVVAALASELVAQQPVRVGYLIGAHTLALAWMAENFSDLSAASEWVTVAWGVYGLMLLLGALEAGRRSGRYLVRPQAFAASAIVLAVAKLLVVDMAQVSALVRIPLFLGAGLALIGVSAFFQRAAARSSPSKELTSRSPGEPASRFSGG